MIATATPTSPIPSDFFWIEKRPVLSDPKFRMSIYADSTGPTSVGVQQVKTFDNVHFDAEAPEGSAVRTAVTQVVDALAQLTPADFPTAPARMTPGWMSFSPDGSALSAEKSLPLKSDNPRVTAFTQAARGLAELVREG